MNINWIKFWPEQLPFCFRKMRILALIGALCFIISRLWSDWIIWDERVRQRAAYTWQVFWLERLVWIEMGVVIIIEPADGHPFDFIVNVSSITDAETYDEGRLRGLIDRYKLAGKSYRIIDSAIVREVRFIDHFCERTSWQYAVSFVNYVCERGQYIYKASFVNHVCEKENAIIDNLISVVTEGYHSDTNMTTITCFSAFSVASNIKVDIKFGSRTESLTIRKGHDGGSINLIGNITSSKWEIIAVSPPQDDTYNYIFSK